MNEAMKKHMEDALEQGVRLDGRKLDEFRPITIETGVVANAEGRQTNSRSSSTSSNSE